MYNIHTRHILMSLIASLLVFSAIVAAQEPDRLLISHTEDSYVLTVPVSRLKMTIPATSLSQQVIKIGGSTNNPRYFNFSDPSRGLVLSGWFEPASSYRGIKAFWEHEQAAWQRNGLQKPMDVSFEKVNGWEVIFYQQPLPVGTSLNARAHFVQMGTWIDLHISMTTRDVSSASRPAIETILKSISINDKPSN